jgi:VCBS repeat-containing protein
VSNIATVSFNITSANDAPVAVNDGPFLVDEGAIFSSGGASVLDNDTDAENDPLTAVLVTGPVNADAFTLNSNGTFSYTHNGSETTSDSFTYRASDGSLSNVATVAITVNPVNDRPVAANDAPPAIDEGGLINGTFNVLDNDTDAEDDALTAVLVAGPAQADSFNLNANGTFTYQHNGSDTVTDSFSYQASDGELSNVATVTISINSVNDAPVAFNDGPFSVDEGASFDSGASSVLDNDTDAENDPLTAVLVAPPANAAAFTLDTDGTFSYTHNGSETTSDSFTYRADDGSPSNVATVSFTINAVNDAPTFIGIVPPGLSTPEDTTLTIPVSALQIDDPDGPGPLVLTLDPVLPPDANYTLAGPASITPAEDFNGDLSVRATVSDGLDDSAPFLIPVTVTAENDAPVLDAEIGPQTAIENSLFTLDVSGNFSDSDVGDTLTFFATGLPPSGNITINPVSGVISGTPTVADARDDDPYLVIVTAQDPAGASVSDEFNLVVSALDRANIGLTIGVSPESGFPNDQLQWTFTAANPVGPAPGENVELTGSFFGNGLSVAAGSGSSCSINLLTGRADFVCTIGALPVTGTASVTFTTTASQATEVIAFGTAAGAQTVPIDPNTADNSAVRAVGVAESFSDGAVQFLGGSTILSVAAGDFNGDGTTDLVVGTAAGQPVQVYLGDDPRESCNCQRDFVATPISIPDTGSNQGIAVADFDNDGNLDIVIANGGGQPDAVYHNTGSGNFVLSALLAPSNGRDVAVGDFNNDGNMDIAIAATSPNPVYFGDGAGGFGDGVLLGDVDSFDVAVGRFDNDQFDDLVFANVGTASQVWINNGGTGFAPGAALQIGDAVAVAAADLNGDNLDDLVFGRIPGGTGDIPANPVLINQGGGTFDGTQELGISPTVDVLIGDVSDDGLPDLVFINESGVHQIWTANAGTYALHAEQIIDIGARAGVLANLGFADTDDPGGADLALGGALGAGAAVYLNDSAGNLGLGDAVAPEITLNGELAVNVPAGTAYNDAGASAADNIDGDISSSIVVSNPVNTAVVGAYTVTYNVQDFAGNPATQVTRTVNVTAATGRGGGGGGSLGYGALALLVAMQLMFLMRSRQAAQTRQTKRT